MQQRQTRLAQMCEYILEAGWLLALFLIPSYFNLLSSRHFEPDKATTLRAIVLIMAAAGIVRWLEGMWNKTSPRTSAQVTGGLFSRFWQRFRAVPLAVPTAVYILVFLLATAFSVVPLVSFWGSYQRLQGTYTNLSYVVLGILVVLNLRHREQLDRLVTVLILGSLMPVVYGIVQHYQIDPLPWKGDVVSRVASTMGNSIFVAAYLIMVVPYALYRAVLGFHEARHAPREGRAGVDIGWAAAYVLLIGGGLLIAFASLQFGAVVRTNDLRYWWVYLGALLALFALAVLPTLRPHTAERISARFVLPGVFTLLYVLFLGLMFSVNQGNSQTVQAQPGRSGTEWPLVMALGTILMLIGNVLVVVLPRRPTPSSLFKTMQGIGFVLVSLLLLVTIFFTQSRGPWLGIGVGLFVFFTLLLWQAYRNDRAAGLARARTWMRLLVGEMVLFVVIGVLLVVFNLSDAPVFQQLRTVPYIGRMGTLFDTSAGTTGDVRMKIWFGDDKAGGAWALITSNPVRTVVGWGPESMFVAYNPFYPPSLANVESRGASPDRSHEAYLDELVTKGVLGLLSYIFVLVSFFVLAARLLRRVGEWRTQMLVIACVAVVVSHAVEGLFGIPIVATLMLLWTTLAVTVVAGALAGEYDLDATPVVPAAPVAEPATEEPGAKPVPAAGKNRRNQPQRQRGAVARGAAQTRAPARRGEANLAGWLVYAVVGLAALYGSWAMNADNVYADMRFQQGQLYTDNTATLQQQFIGASHFIDSINLEPDQDFYYLSLGRTLMSIVDIERQLQASQPSIQLGQPKPNASFEEVLRQTDPTAVQTFLLGKSLQETMSYAQAVLQRAYELNPLNKDHSANLGRLHKFWYSRLDRNAQHLQDALKWYEISRKVAPQDVVIMNEYAGTLALMGDYLTAQNDSSNAQQYYDQAMAQLDQSKALDPRYGDTDVMRADLLRLQGKAAEAIDQYIAMLQKNPHAIDNQLDLIAGTFRDQPDQLKRLSDAYQAAFAANTQDGQLIGNVGRIALAQNDFAAAEPAFKQQVALQPESFDALRNYTVVLSETSQYTAAVPLAQKLKTLADQQRNQQLAQQMQYWAEYLQQRAGG